jgi:aryl-alcohol dehydrogenase-like predicted oxidoreductase
MEYRTLGSTNLRVSAVALGCWPIAGMTSAGVTRGQSLATIATCLDRGINFFDTAYNYGLNGESERLLAEGLRGRRQECVIATKGGLRWGPDGKQIRDARPETLRWQCEESLRRLETDCVELLFLHAPDPHVPLTESAGGLRELLDEGKTRGVGVSNCSLAQLREFAAVCPLIAYQPHYNMLQREIEQDRLPWCIANGVAVTPYWPLMKGFLAGKLPRDHVFTAGDGRAKYPMYQGVEWQRNHDLLDELRPIAAEAGRSLAQVAINWTIHQPGITAALCGAKRPDQAVENAAAADWRLTGAQRERIDAALRRRGMPTSRAAVE